MSDTETAIHNSTDRRNRLSQAVEAGAKVKVTPKYPRLNKIGAELEHMEAELAPHGLTVADLLRTIAKAHHGVVLPVLQPSEYHATPSEVAEG